MMIHASVSKNDIEQLVPLNDLALQVVEELRQTTNVYEFAFPGIKRGKRCGHIHNTTVATMVREFCEKRNDVTKFTSQHDVRRTVKTTMGKAGISKEVRDRIQNHALNDVSTKHYDRYDYLSEKRHGLKIWNDYLGLIINPRKNVRQLKRKDAS